MFLMALGHDPDELRRDVQPRRRRWWRRTPPPMPSAYADKRAEEREQLRHFMQGQPDDQSR